MVLIYWGWGTRCCQSLSSIRISSVFTLSPRPSDLNTSCSPSALPRLIGQGFRSFLTHTRVPSVLRPSEHTRLFSSLLFGSPQSLPSSSPSRVIRRHPQLVEAVHGGDDRLLSVEELAVGILLGEILLTGGRRPHGGDGGPDRNMGSLRVDGLTARRSRNGLDGKPLACLAVAMVVQKKRTPTIKAVYTECT